MPTQPDPQAPEDDRTIGQILGLADAAPSPAPGFATMADTPDELVDPTTGKPPAQPPAEPAPVPTPAPDEPQPPEPAIAALNDQRRQIYEQQRARYPGSQAARPAITPSDADITRSNVTYESRIQIVDAWQYPGRLSPTTPDWIDRNWVGYADDDPIRQIAAGPCLRVPSAYDPNEVVLARIGDYVCRQQVLTEDGGPPVIRTEVWAAEQFQRLFIPVRARPAEPSTPPPGPEVSAGRGAGKPEPGTPPKLKSSQPRKRGKPDVSPRAA